MKFETVRIHFLSDVLICCHPEILLPRQRDVTTSLYLRHSLGSNLVLSPEEHGLISRTAAGNRAYIKCYCVSLMPNFLYKGIYGDGG